MDEYIPKLQIHQQLGPHQGHVPRNNQRADCSDTTNPDLCVKKMKEQIQSHNNKHFAKITKRQ